jgi:hypothetical protein
VSVFLNPLSSETSGSIGTKLGKNVYWMVLSKFYRFFWKSDWNKNSQFWVLTLFWPLYIMERVRAIKNLWFFCFFCLIGLERPKGIKKSVVCLCMWRVYFSTNLDGGFLIFLITWGPPNGHSHTVWFRLAKWFQKRRFKIDNSLLSH